MLVFQVSLRCPVIEAAELQWLGIRRDRQLHHLCLREVCRMRHAITVVCADRKSVV